MFVHPCWQLQVEQGELRIGSTHGHRASAVDQPCARMFYLAIMLGSTSMMCHARGWFTSLPLQSMCPVHALSRWLQDCERPAGQTGAPLIIQDPAQLADLVNRQTAERLAPAHTAAITAVTASPTTADGSAEAA